MKRLLWLPMFLLACEDSGPKATVIGSTSVEIDTRKVHVRIGEAAIGNWMSDLLLRKVNEAGNSAQVALINAGAIRGGEDRGGRKYPPGSLTDLDVASWFPFNDDHVVFTVTGTQLKSAIERGASQLPPDIKAGQGGPFFQLAGAAYVVDCAGEPQQLNAMNDMIMVEGTRVRKLTIGTTVIWDATMMIDRLAATTVKVTANNFLADGRDGHLAFADKTNATIIAQATFNFVDVMQVEVKATSPIAPRTDGRISIVGDCGRPLTEP